MIKSIKYKLLSLATVLSVIIPLGFSSMAYAQVNLQNTVANQGCSGSQAVNTGGSCANAQSGLTGLVTTILDVLSWIVGIVAVIMIIIAGFRYIVSGGESGGVQGAKNAILFAIVGIVIVAIAQIIVQFVLQKSTSAPTTP
jgi:beta-lactamase regulating signal transducer with metallopeptidase domain